MASTKDRRSVQKTQYRKFVINLRICGIVNTFAAEIEQTTDRFFNGTEDDS